jgi:hypothetical protein
MTDKKTYHDYVIKDEKFIGKFNEMFSEFKDPWTQSTQPNKSSRMARIIYVKNFNIKPRLYQMDLYFSLKMRSYSLRLSSV